MSSKDESVAKGEVMDRDPEPVNRDSDAESQHSNDDAKKREDTPEDESPKPAETKATPKVIRVSKLKEIDMNTVVPWLGCCCCIATFSDCFPLASECEICGFGWSAECCGCCIQLADCVHFEQCCGIDECACCGCTGGKCCNCACESGKCCSCGCESGKCCSCAPDCSLPVCCIACCSVGVTVEPPKMEFVPPVIGLNIKAPELPAVTVEAPEIPKVEMSAPELPTVELPTPQAEVEASPCCCSCLFSCFGGLCGGGKCCGASCDSGKCCNIGCQEGQCCYCSPSCSGPSCCCTCCRAGVEVQRPTIEMKPGSMNLNMEGPRAPKLHVKGPKAPKVHMSGPQLPTFNGPKMKGHCMKFSCCPWIDLVVPGCDSTQECCGFDAWSCACRCPCSAYCRGACSAAKVKVMFGSSIPCILNVGSLNCCFRFRRAGGCCKDLATLAQIAGFSAFEEVPTADSAEDQSPEDEDKDKADE